MNTLPDKPSDLIRLAMRDLELCEKDSRYRVNMTSWHNPLGDGQCRVCLAGAVMACELGAQVEAEYYPDAFPDDVADKLMFLDAVRFGFFDTSLCPYIERERRQKIQSGLRQRLPDGPAKYAKSPINFKRDMEVIAALFEEHGL